MAFVSEWLDDHVFTLARDPEDVVPRFNLSCSFP
jgi:hypothetical protein